MDWAKTATLVATIESQQLSDDQKSEFVDEFRVLKNQNNQNGDRYVGTYNLLYLFMIFRAKCLQGG